MVKKRKFNWLNICKSPDDHFGIYVIWSDTVCVYVGKTEKQSIKQRLLQHYTNSHNEKLYGWVQSSYTLWFSFETVSNVDSIDAKERNRVKRYAPVANKHLRKKEHQYGY